MTPLNAQPQHQSVVDYLDYFGLDDDPFPAISKPFMMAVRDANYFLNCCTCANLVPAYWSLLVRKVLAKRV